jgi:hypothetical protein
VDSRLVVIVRGGGVIVKVRVLRVVSVVAEAVLAVMVVVAPMVAVMVVPGTLPPDLRRVRSPYA